MIWQSGVFKVIIINCNLQGQKHKSRNVHCEDGFYSLTENGVTALAVADGAGSSKYPHAKIGADIVSRTICRFFCKKFDEFYDVCNETEMRKIITTVCITSLNRQAEKLGLDSCYTMASTLIVVAFKNNRAIACQIGDGLLGMKKGGELEPVFLPQNGEFAGTTFFITDENAYQFLQVKKFFTNSISHIFLMTDGASDIVYDDHTGYFEPVMDRLLDFTKIDDGSEKLSKCLEENIVNQNELSDDCTMIIASLSNEVGDIENETDSIFNHPRKTIETDRELIQDTVGLDKSISSSDYAGKNEEKAVTTTTESKAEDRILIYFLIIALAVFAFVSGFLSAGRCYRNRLTDKNDQSTSQSEKTSAISSVDDNVSTKNIGKSETNDLENNITKAAETGDYENNNTKATETDDLENSSTKMTDSASEQTE